MRRDLKYYEQRDFRGGVNQEEENASPNQVYDARNVWCPNGILEQRPGCLGMSSVGDSVNGADSLTSDNIWILEDVTAGTFTHAHDADPNFEIVSADIGDRWYFGTSTTYNASGMLVCIELDAVHYNDAAGVCFKAEYYNGSEWVWLPCQEITDEPDTDAYHGFMEHPKKVYTLNPHLSEINPATSYQNNVFRFAFPNDFSSTTVGGFTRYFIRFIVVGTNFSTDSDASVTLLTTNSVAYYIFDDKYSDAFGYEAITNFVFASEIGFYNGNKYIFVNCDFPPYMDPASMEILYVSAPRQGSGDRMIHSFSDYFNPMAPASSAFVPDVSEFYFSFAGTVFMLSPDSDYTIDPVAVVEASDALVGTGKSFDPDWVDQLTEFPKASFISWFQGQLWASGIKDEPCTVRWSAPLPAHKVWPSISYEFLVDADNSPITGMGALSEYLVVFKRDSVWKMVHNGLDSQTGLNSYTPVKDISGIGCICSASIVNIPDGIVFLSEDGVYLYNGTPNVIKLSGAIDQTVGKIADSVSIYGRGVNWKKNNCYLLAVPYGKTTTNNVVLVYDYKSKQTGEDGVSVGSWWIWDDMEVASWMLAESETDRQQLYYVDIWSRLMLVGARNTDHGAPITSYIETHRIGDTANGTAKRAREVRVASNNKVTSLSVQVKPDDESFDSTGDTLSFEDPSGVEAPIGSFKFGTSGQFVEKRKREARLATRVDGEWFRIRVENSNKNQKMELHNISVGTVELGAR